MKDEGISTGDISIIFITCDAHCDEGFNDAPNFITFKCMTGLPNVGLFLDRLRDNNNVACYDEMISAG